MKTTMYVPRPTSGLNPSEALQKLTAFPPKLPDSLLKVSEGMGHMGSRASCHTLGLVRLLKAL